MNTRTRTLLPTALALTTALLSVPAAQDGGAGDEAPLRFVRVSVADAAVRNLADDDGIALARLEEGTPLAVWKELAGWLEVEVPGGLRAWMHGRYLRPTDTEGVYEVTRNAINVRPLPKSEVTSFPLPQRLHAGDRVRVLGRSDSSVALEETWARIVTPPGVHAWIRADATEPIGSPEDGRAAWTAAAAEAAERLPAPETKADARGGEGAGEPAAARAQAGAPAGGAPAAQDGAGAAAGDDAARAELLEIRAAIDAERVKAEPEYAPLRERLVQLQRELRTGTASSQGALALEVEGELARLRALEEVLVVRAELERERERVQQELWERQRGVQEASRAKDPLGGIYLTRGILIRTSPADDSPRYQLRWGGETVCEVLCTSGRYDLDLALGYEVGIFGDELKLADESAGKVVDVRRLEVVRRR